MKKILYFIPTLTGGGAEKVLVNLVNNMDRESFDITVLTLFDVGVNRENLKSHIKYKYVFKRLFRGNIHILKLFSRKFLFRKMIKEEYDIIVSYLQGPTTRIVSGCLSEKTKLVNWIHQELHDTKSISRSYRSLAEAMDSYARFDMTVFVSKTAQEAFLDTFSDFVGKSCVKYNTVETNEIIEKSNEEIKDISLMKDRVNLVSVGRFTIQKGYERLLKVLSKVVLDGFKVHLYLLGSGELEKKYHEIIKEEKLEDYVTFLGYQKNPYKYVKQCDLFVCSSFWEGFSTAVTESLIVGTPVVTTLCSGMEEMLGSNSEFGLITENSDDAFYLGLKELLLDLDKLNHYKEKALIRGKEFSTIKTVDDVERMLNIL